MSKLPTITKNHVRIQSEYVDPVVNEENIYEKNDRLIDNEIKQLFKTAKDTADKNRINEVVYNTSPDYTIGDNVARIMSWNIHQWKKSVGKESNKDDVIDVVKKLTPQILLLQEDNNGNVENLLKLFKDNYDNQMFYYGSNCGNQNTILSFFPIVKSNTYKFNDSRFKDYKSNIINTDNSRCFTLVEIKWGDKPIQLVCTHLSIYITNQKAVRKAQAEILKGFMRNIRKSGLDGFSKNALQLIAGDFNSFISEDGEAYEVLRNEKWKDIFYEVNPDESKQPLWSSKNTSKPKTETSRIDTIMFHSLLKGTLKGAYIYYSSASDHLPLIADINSKYMAGGTKSLKLENNVYIQKMTDELRNKIYNDINNDEKSIIASKANLNFQIPNKDDNIRFYTLNCNDSITSNEMTLNKISENIINNKPDIICLENILTNKNEIFDLKEKLGNYNNYFYVCTRDENNDEILESIEDKFIGNVIFFNTNKFNSDTNDSDGKSFGEKQKLKNLKNNVVYKSGYLTIKLTNKSDNKIYNFIVSFLNTLGIDKKKLIESLNETIRNIKKSNNIILFLSSNISLNNESISDLIDKKLTDIYKKSNIENPISEPKSSIYVSKKIQKENIKGIYQKFTDFTEEIPIILDINQTGGKPYVDYGSDNMASKKEPEEKTTTESSNFSSMPPNFFKGLPKTNEYTKNQAKSFNNFYSKMMKTQSNKNSKNKNSKNKNSKNKNSKNKKPITTLKKQLNNGISSMSQILKASKIATDGTTPCPHADFLPCFHLDTSLVKGIINHLTVELPHIEKHAYNEQLKEERKSFYKAKKGGGKRPKYILTRNYKKIKGGDNSLISADPLDEDPLSNLGQAKENKNVTRKSLFSLQHVLNIIINQERINRLLQAKLSTEEKNTIYDKFRQLGSGLADVIASYELRDSLTALKTGTSSTFRLSYFTAKINKIADQVKTSDGNNNDKPFVENTINLLDSAIDGVNTLSSHYGKFIATRTEKQMYAAATLAYLARILSLGMEDNVDVLRQFTRNKGKDITHIIKELTSYLKTSTYLDEIDSKKQNKEVKIRTNAPIVSSTQSSEKKPKKPKKIPKKSSKYIFNPAEELKSKKYDSKLMLSHLPIGSSMTIHSITKGDK
jgi:endonuclease/exonuclease/phosphatase family metal-dependent hydrolase